MLFVTNVPYLFVRFGWERRATAQRWGSTWGSCRGERLSSVDGRPREPWPCFCPTPSVHPPWIHLIIIFILHVAHGLWFLRTPKQTKCIFALHFSKTSTVVIVCTADGWSLICHHVAGVRRQHNNTNLFHINQALFKSIGGILILKPSGGEIQQKLVQ